MKKANWLKRADWLFISAAVSALDDFTRSYIETALFTSTQDEGIPLEREYDIEDIAPSSLNAMVSDCQQFQQQNAEALQEKSSIQGGHDFWLTRNGHGAGFWDGDWPENGKTLTLAAKKFGEANLYVGDDGYIYQGGTETGDAVPPREEFTPTDEDKEFMKGIGITGSAKTALYVEEQWEDILQKKGYVVDQSTETPWEDSLYINPNLPDAQVTLHESGESYYVIKLNGEVVIQDTDPEVLWDTLSNLPEMDRQSIHHDREFNENDQNTLREMGITSHKKSKLLDKRLPKLAFDFDPQAERKYDYEANSNNGVVLISPANATKPLQGDEANHFWAALDHIENETMEATQEEYLKRIQDLLRSYFDADAKAASKKCVIQVNASAHKRSSATFISGVEYVGIKVEKMKFTADRRKAKTFSLTAAAKLIAQLPDFRLSGTIKE
jgi:hypothetical protein